MANEITFGAFIKAKRLNLDPYISLRKMAEMLNLSPTYMSKIETERYPAPKGEILASFAHILKLDKAEEEQMYELAAKTKENNTVPADLPEYLNAKEYARVALRVAKDVDATDEEWIEFIEKLKKRGQQQE